MAYDLKNEEEVKEYLENLETEYIFGCVGEKRADSCHLLGDYLEAVKKDFVTAGKIFQTNCDERCHAKSCYKYGTYNLIGKEGHKKDLGKAFFYFKKGCVAGEAAACLSAGILCLSSIPGSNLTEDYFHGLHYLEKACNENNADSCYCLSGIYIKGFRDFIKKDMKKAHSYSLKACELGNMYSCGNLSQMYQKGDGVEKNEKLAKKYKEIALEMQEQMKEQRPITFQQGDV